ncbi:MAG: hybrid sensor histidine kinase/response regulator, partial [Roseburia sp.]
MKYEQERQRATHLMILLVYTIATIVLTGESFLLGWETGAIVLLIIGLAASWVIHITGRIPESIRIWLYFILTMLAFFFYGIHETSIYDLAPVMVLIILMYSATEMYSIVRLCVATYFLTMGYDFVFVIGDSTEFSALVVTRTLLHLALVCMAGKLVEIEIQRRQTEKKITDSKIAELEETNRRTEDFLANVSHELRTPINAVTGITAVMLKNETDAEKRKDIVSVQKAGGRLFNQIEDILDYTEIDTGRIKVGEDTYMITSIVNDIIAGNRLLMRENTRELILDVDAGIPSVLLGDGRKIKKILMHLIDNAIKFTKRGGVYVRVYALHKPYGINLCIRVCDTGIGIAEEDLGKIKERFFQSNGGRNRRAGGLGLGLSIVYGMVTSMEGFMQIESTLGSGTTVSVSIPQKVSEEAPSMVVENRTSLCLACFLRPEKYEVPEVRDYYNEMISHMVQGLDIPLHRAYNIEEMKKLTSVYQLTHLFLGREEYEENKSYFEELAESMGVFAVGDEDFILPQGSRVRLLRKPFYSFTVASILNAVATEDAEMFREKRMICPNVTVLVVDDEPMNLMVAEEIFKGYQMKVKTAESGREAIEICEREDFDLIFMDHMMPEMDGVETLKQLRKITKDSGRVLTVIALTANAVSGAREMFLQEGFDEFVSKPIETSEMERALRKVLP